MHGDSKFLLEIEGRRWRLICEPSGEIMESEDPLWLIGYLAASVGADQFGEGYLLGGLRDEAARAALVFAAAAVASERPVQQEEDGQ